MANFKNYDVTTYLTNTYWTIFQEVKTIRQWNLVSLIEHHNHTKNMMEKLFLCTLQKKNKKNWVYVWINSLKFYTVFFLLYTNLRTIKALTLNLYKAFLKKQKQFFFLSFAKNFYIVFYPSYVSICKDLQNAIVLSSGPLLQVFTFII